MQKKFHIEEKKINFKNFSFLFSPQLILVMSDEVNPKLAE